MFGNNNFPIGRGGGRGGRSGGWGGRSGGWGGRSGGRGGQTFGITGRQLNRGGQGTADGNAIGEQEDNGEGQTIGETGRRLNSEEGNDGNGIEEQESDKKDEEGPSKRRWSYEEEDEDVSPRWRKARASAYFNAIGNDLWIRNVLSELYDREFNDAMKVGPPDKYIWDPESTDPRPPINRHGITLALYNMRRQQNPNADPSTSASMVEENKDDEDDVHQALEAPLKDAEGNDDEF